jgi:sodium/bile acid cotransporter 7
MIRAWLDRLHVDGYIVLLAGMVVLATLLPARGLGAQVASLAADTGIVLLFFLHGARLSREAIRDGARHWRLHGATGAVTYLLFPLLGLVLTQLLGLDPALALGLLYLTLLPSTVQSAIAFTAMARGNVAAAVCSAAFSNLAGIFLTPLLVTLLITGKSGGLSGAAVLAIAGQLLLPFLAGHLARPWLGAWIGRQKRLTTAVDRGAILLVVYASFSAAVVEGLWSRVSWADLAVLVALSSALLAVVLWLTWVLGRWLGFSREDAIVLQFCGSKKSLATGVPMAGVLFPASQLGTILLPVMIFHQIQLMVCAVLARRYGAAQD